MTSRQDRAPLGAKLAVGLVLLGTLVLFSHNALGVPWPPAPPHAWWEWLYNVLEIAAGLLCLGRAMARRSERAAWIAIGIGMLSFAAGDLYYSLVWGSEATNVPFPSAADAMYLGFYPPVYAGIYLLLRARTGRLPAGLWMDGLIGALAIAALGAALVLGPVLSATHGHFLTVATNLAYPLGDLVLLGLLVGIIAVTGWHPRGGWWLIALGLLVFTVADAIYLVQSAEGTYVADGLLDVGWPGGMVIMALAAWQRPPARRGIRTHGAAMFVVPTFGALASLSLEFADHFHRLPLVAHVLAVACLITVVARLGMTFGENISMLKASRSEAVTDALTGLGNRRALKLDLQARLAAHPIEPFVLAFYDLDGFKVYNDTFGHQAGDALLSRLGARVAALVPEASVYRMGGDEFCVLASQAAGAEAVALRAAEALVESGATFEVGCSFGTVLVPDEAQDPETAMLLADTRMYDQKGERRPSAAQESHNVLLRALAERNDDLGQHNDDVAELVDDVCAELGLEASTIVSVRRAAELHDVGKLAIPDAILNKPGPLDDTEWAFMRRHTIVGERIVAAATSLRDVAPMVRASHERWDGGGYPDGLAGEQIPLGARIIAVCDAYDAMTTTRPYRAGMTTAAALAELRRCAGSQFDPAVVQAFERVLACQADEAPSQPLAA